jgi:hypothetical protein
MNQGTSPQARPGWPITTRRERRRRESKSVYHNNPGYSTRRIPSPASPGNSARQKEQFQFQPPALQTLNLGYDYFTVQQPSSSNQDSNFNNVVHQHDPSLTENAFFPSMYYTLPLDPSNSPHQMFNGNESQSPIGGQPQMFSHDQDILWSEIPSGNSDIGSEMEGLSDFHFGSFSSVDSMELPTPDTATSSMHSGDFVFPVPEPTFGPSGTTDPMTGLAMPGKSLPIWFALSSQGFLLVALELRQALPATDSIINSLKT